MKFSEKHLRTRLKSEVFKLNFSLIAQDQSVESRTVYSSQLAEVTNGECYTFCLHLKYYCANGFSSLWLLFVSTSAMLNVTEAVIGA